MIEDLLGRDEVPADPKLLGPALPILLFVSPVLVDRSVPSCAAKSLLCHRRGLFYLSAANRLFMRSSSSFARFFRMEVIQAVLGSATDLQLLQRLFTDQSVDLVFHAAAYKHVPC